MVTMIGSWSHFLIGLLLFVGFGWGTCRALDTGVFTYPSRGSRAIQTVRAEEPRGYWLLVVTWCCVSAVGFLMILPNLVLWSRWGMAYLIMSPAIVHSWLS
jgi:hypothetical protein